MRKMYEYLEEILESPVSNQLTGYQRTTIDAAVEIFKLCSYEQLCDLVKNNLLKNGGYSGYFA